MPIPLIYIAGAALIGGGLWAGHETGKRIGEATGKMLPWAGASVIAIMAYKAAQK